MIKEGGGGIPPGAYRSMCSWGRLSASHLEFQGVWYPSPEALAHALTGDQLHEDTLWFTEQVRSARQERSDHFLRATFPKRELYPETTPHRPGRPKLHATRLRLALFNPLAAGSQNRLVSLVAAFGRKGADVMAFVGTQIDDKPEFRVTTMGDYTRIHFGRRARNPGTDRVGGLELFLRGDVFPTDGRYEFLQLGPDAACLKGRLGGIIWRNREAGEEYCFVLG